MVLRILAALFIGICVAVAFRQTWVYERQVAKYGFPLEKHRGRDTVIWVSPLMLPIFFVMLFTMLAVLRDTGVAADVMQEFLLELIVTQIV